MEFWLIILFLLLSAYFSGSETVFLSVNRIRLEGFIRRGRMGARDAHWFLKKPSRFILTTLVGTNLANIAFTSILTVYLLNRGVPPAWISAISAIIILVTGEIIPKALGRDLADPASLWVAPVLRFFRILFYPVVLISDWVSSLILTLFGVGRSDVREFFTRKDLEILIRKGVETGAIKSHHESLITRIMQFRSLRGRDVMTPRTEIVALDQDASIDDLKKTAFSSGYSKIPIYLGDIDNIIGVAYIRDLIDKPASLNEIIRSIPFFPTQKKAWQIFRDLKTERQQIAIILDEWGGTAGLVTLEDLIEELTGEIEDEYDPARLSIQKLGDNRWLISGRMEVDEINDHLDTAIPEGDYETLSGYLIASLGRIPSKGEIIEIGDYRFEIAKATRTRIRVVVLEKIEG